MHVTEIARLLMELIEECSHVKALPLAAFYYCRLAGVESFWDGKQGLIGTDTEGHTL